MTCTISRTTTHRTARSIVVGLITAVLCGTPVAAQDDQAWREPYAAGMAALEAGDTAQYAAEMARTVALLPPTRLNRPFVQYHAARAYALLGDAERCAHFLAMAWDEGIESLMISFARYDAAFDGVRKEPGFVEVMGRPDEMTLGVTHLAGNVYLLDGAGSTVVAFTGPDGVVLADTGYGPALGAVRRAAASLNSGEISALILTHPHEDHVGAAGVLAETVPVYAHPRTFAALTEPYAFIEGVASPPKFEAGFEPAEAVVIDSDTTMRINGERVRFIPLEAHTDADIVIYFEDSGVVDFGDVFISSEPVMYPGRDPEGYLARVDALLADLPESTVVVGGHDEPLGLDAVRHQIAETRVLMSIVRDARADGATLDETVERAEGRFIAPWVSFFYRVFAAQEG